MSPSADSYDDMHFLPGGDDAAERLLTTHLAPADAPASYHGVNTLFEALRAPGSSAELANQNQVVAAMATEVLKTTQPLGAATRRRRPVLSKILTAKVAAAATIAAFGVGTAAAAVNGALPGQTSNANSHAQSGLTVAASHTAAGTSSNSSTGDTTGSASGSVTNSVTNSGSVTNSSSSSSIPATGPANIHAQFGLCQAFLAGQNSSSTSSSTSNPPQYSSTAFQALIAQNGSVSATTTYCHGVVTAHSTGTAQANSTSTGKPANVGRSASSPGRPTSTPASTHGNAPVSTPNHGGTNTAGTASGGASSSGSSTANTASGGASSAGAGNSSNHR